MVQKYGWIRLQKLEFPFSFTEGSREITIFGEAYIKVAKNPSKPFIVHLPGSTVQVLGTEFNVNTYDSGIVKVSLVEGMVNFKGTGIEVRLKREIRVFIREEI